MMTDVKSMFRVGDALVPLILMCDGIHLSNFAGNKKESRLYLAISTLSSRIGQMPSTNSVVMVALLPILIKHRNISQKRLDRQRQTTREVLNEVLLWQFRPQNFRQNPSTESRYYNVLCTHGNFRRCKPVFATWLADCPEYCDLQHLELHVSFRSKCSKNELGDSVPPDMQHSQQDHNLY